MPQVTIITDLTSNDPYLGMAKSVLHRQLPGVHLIDLSTGEDNKDLISVVYILKSSLGFFPEGSVHLIAVKNTSDRPLIKPEWASDPKRFLVCRYLSQWIITPDNGLLSLLGEGLEIFNVFYDDPKKGLFYLRDLFPYITASLLQDQHPENVGLKTQEFSRLTWPEPYVQGNVLKGQKIYQDAFGNIITNITKNVFEAACPKGHFEVVLPGAVINTLHTYYYDVPYGQPLLLFNSANYLEVSICGQSAADLLIPRSIATHRFFQITLQIL
jgi:S-adenosylmethionine hydrolase